MAMVINTDAVLKTLHVYTPAVAFDKMYDIHDVQLA